MAEGRSHRKKRKSAIRTVYNPKAMQRMHQAWELYVLGYSIFAISQKLKCHWHTADKDIHRAQAMCDAGHLRRAEDARAAAIRIRRGVQQLALEDREAVDPKDRAQFLRVVLDGQKGIEDLEGLHPEEPTAPQANVFLFPLGDGAQPQLGELSDEELAEAAAKNKAEQEALPEAGKEAEEPAAEYTAVEEPAPAEPESEPDS